jgi:tetratricopeptide (TPR) repeat protein
MKRLLCTFVCSAAFALCVSRAHAGDFNGELASLQQDWATANYATPAGDRQVQAFDALATRAEEFVKANPGRAEPLIWQGIVLSTYAGAKGGLGALTLAKRSRTALEAALAIDPDALDGSAYTSLGTLYFKVPGFPLGFGSKSKANDYLKHALALNPDGIDPNFFYGEFLLEQERYEEALAYLERAREAPSRPGRELADAGRHKEIEAMIARVRSEQ